MVFSSIEFIYLFLPVAVGGYFLCPSRLKNLWLFAVSLFFYAFGEPIYVFLMLLAILIGYFAGRVIEWKRQLRVAVLCLTAVFFVGLLFFFKYYDPLARLLSLPTHGLALPIGISFYTFQVLSYIIDVYRGDIRAERSLVAFGAYLSLFPQLIAGPIVKYTDVSAELNRRRHSLSHTADGIARFCVGLAKKILLANGAGALAETVAAESNLLSMSLWLLLFALQIYYDFSGYSDMAIGLGAIFGFRFPENFNYPYISESITEFWRRWHITLSSWFREYIYIPLGGNRHGRLRTLLNLLAVWALTGLWHGAGWNFLAWGIYFFIILVIEKYLLFRLLPKIPKFLRHAYSVVLILLGWLIFAADGLELSALGGIITSAPADPRTAYLLLRNLPYIAVMLVGVTPLPKKLFESFSQNAPRLFLTARNILALLSLLLSTADIASSGYNPFLYFRF